MSEEVKTKFENLRNSNIKSFICLKNINKVYPNGFQAVYDFNLDIKENEFIVFVGPSGCGKSTTLRMIAGLEDITAGDLYINQIYSNNLTPKDRDLAMVFQNYALYPHMSVYDNMAFSLKMKHVDKNEINKRVHEAAEILDLTHVLDRKPRQLSGGQMQRVALGRTIVRKAKIFLMDEPLSNLDAKLRVSMRSEIIKLHQRLNTTSIYVTHDQTEAMTMATRIVVMNKGKIQQIGTPEEIYNNPQNKFVASFIGTPAMNIIKGHYDGKGTINFEDGFKVSLSEDRKNKIKSFIEEQIHLLLERLKNVDYEVELLPHQASKDELKHLKNNESKENENTEEYLNDLESSIKAHNIVSKAVLKGTNQFSWKKIFSKKHKLPTKQEVKENLLKEINQLINKYKTYLIEGFDVTFGVRPEHIDLEDTNNFINKSEPVKIKITIAELLGNEYYIHADYNGIDLVSKINADNKIKAGDEIEVTFNLDKIHIFDELSEKTVL